MTPRRGSPSSVAYDVAGRRRRGAVGAGERLGVQRRERRGEVGRGGDADAPVLDGGEPDDRDRSSRPASCRRGRGRPPVPTRRRCAPTAAARRAAARPAPSRRTRRGCCWCRRATRCRRRTTARRRGPRSGRRAAAPRRAVAAGRWSRRPARRVRTCPAPGPRRPSRAAHGSGVARARTPGRRPAGRQATSGLVRRAADRHASYRNRQASPHACPIFGQGSGRLLRGSRCCAESFAESTGVCRGPRIREGRRHVGQGGDMSLVGPPGL